MRVENGLSVVEDDEHLLRGKEGPQGCHVFRVFDPSTNGFGEAGKEMNARRGELIAADESTVTAKPFFDAMMVEDGECNRCFPDPPCTDEGDGFEVFGKTDDLFDQLLTPETDSRWWGRHLSRKDAVEM